MTSVAYEKQCSKGCLQTNEFLCDLMIISKLNDSTRPHIEKQTSCMNRENFRNKKTPKEIAEISKVLQ